MRPAFRGQCNTGFDLSRGIWFFWRNRFLFGCLKSINGEYRFVVMKRRLRRDVNRGDYISGKDVRNSVCTCLPNHVKYG